MEGHWLDFYIIMGTIAVVGVISGIFANSIKKAMSKLEYLANGKVTDHHSYIPYD